MLLFRVQRPTKRNNNLIPSILTLYHYICALMQKALISLFLVVFFTVSMLLTGCGEFRQIQKSDNWKEKYEAAIKYYENKDYYRSNLLFEDIIPLIKGMEEGEFTEAREDTAALCMDYEEVSSEEKAEDDPNAEEI